MTHYVYTRPDGGLFRYVVLADKEWPFGRVVSVAHTLPGARRIAKRDARRRKAEKPRQLVEVVS